ncbi:hypothetical protein [Mesobacillus zeae]|nr:hypothetical protein [Mesobacillus zeae]
MLAKISQYIPTWQVFMQAGITMAVPFLLTKLFSSIEDKEGRKKQ